MLKNFKTSTILMIAAVILVIVSVLLARYELIKQFEEPRPEPEEPEEPEEPKQDPEEPEENKPDPEAKIIDINNRA